MQHYPFQVGGHQQIYRHPQKSEEWIVKPSNAREQLFYEATRSLPLMIPIMPDYHGHLANHHLILGDLARGMQNPRVIDVKLGRRIYDVDATEEKRRRKEAKSLAYTNAALGFRICGLVCPNLTLSKEEAKLLKVEQVLPSLRSFFPPDLTPKIRDKCLQIREAVAASPVLMYCTSLLIIIEGSRWECRLIDFSHSHVLAQSYDTNFLDGLDSFISHLNTLINET